MSTTSAQVPTLGSPTRNARWRQRFREVIDAAFELQALKLWRSCPPDHGFLVETGDGAPALAVTIMGAAGLDHGVFALSGPRAFADMVALCEQSVSTEEVSLLSVSMTRLSDLDPGLRPLYKGRGGRRRDRSVPYPMAKPASRFPRDPDEEELAALLILVNGIRAAATRQLLEPRPFVFGGPVQILTIRGSADAPSVRAAMTEAPAAPPAPARRPCVVPLDLARLERLDATWTVGLIGTPMLLDGDPRSISMLAVLDTRTEMILQGTPIFGFDPEAVIDALADVLRGRGMTGISGRPLRIDVCGSRRLHEALHAFLKPLKIECCLKLRDPQFDRVAAELLALSANPEAAAATAALAELLAESGMDPLVAGDLLCELFEEDGDEDALEVGDDRPAPRDVDGWLSWNEGLSDRFDEAAEDAELYDKRRPLRRYFGDRDRGRALLSEPDPGSLRDAYLEWAAVFYRATRRSRTIAERGLMEHLTPAGREVLEARAHGRPTLVRVTQVSTGPRFRGLDLIAGGEETFYDVACDAPISAGAVLPVSVFACGDLRMVRRLGPAIPSGRERAARRFLEGQGLELTAAGFAEKAHLLGRLWAWSASTAVDRET